MYVANLATKAKPWVVAGLALCFWCVATPAHAAPATISVQTSPITLTVADDGDGAGMLTTTNLTDASLSVRLQLTNGPSGCKLSPSTDTLPASTQHDTKVTVSGCQLQNGSAVTVSVAPSGTRRAIAVQAKVAAEPSPDWSQMTDSFIESFLISVVVVVCALVYGCSWKSAKPTAELPGLGVSYDFSKSWATTATLVTTAFAGLFGSTDVLKDIVGKDDKAITALVGVSAALALGFVTAGPLVLAATKGPNGNPTVYGLLLGALLTLTGTGGQLLVLLRVGHGLDLGMILETKTTTWVLGAGLGSVVLLTVYAFRSLLDAIDDGLKPPDKPAGAVTFSRRKKSRRDFHADLRGILNLVNTEDAGAMDQDDDSENSDQTPGHIRAAIDDLYDGDGDELEVVTSASARPRSGVL